MTTLSPSVARLALALATSLWGGNLIAGRLLGGMIDPVSLTLFRWGGALIILLPFTASELWRQRHVLKAHWPALAALGCTGLGGFHLLQYAALAHTTAVNVALQASTMPLIIAFLSWVLFREPLSGAALAGILLSIVGALIVICRGDISILLALQVNRGDLFEALALPFWSLYCVLLRFRPNQLSPLAFIVATIVPAWLLALAVSVFTPTVIELTPQSVVGLAYIILFASVVAYICWNAGNRALGANKAGMFLNVIPFAGAVLGVLILGETFEGYHVVAGALIVTGIVLAERKPLSWRSQPRTP
ncbi:MAG: DMT family transporter [Geminicoccaceae bacterium]